LPAAQVASNETAGKATRAESIFGRQLVAKVCIEPLVNTAALIALVVDFHLQDSTKIDLLDHFSFISLISLIPSQVTTLRLQSFCCV